MTLGVGSAVYMRIGWTQMENHCSADPPGARSYTQVSYSWQWNPLGFTCTYSGGERDGETETSLMF